MGSAQSDVLRRLRFQAPRLTQPATVGGSIGCALAVAYGTVTLSDAIGESLLLFLGSCVLALFLLTMRVERRVRQTTLTLRRIGKGGLSATRENLSRAAAEAMLVPNVIFIGSLLNWVLGTICVGVLLQVFSSTIPWSVTGRIVTLGVLFGPISTLLSYTLVSRRCRLALVTLGELGLTPEDARLALPTTRELRGKLLAFTLIAVGTPLFLTLDVLQQLSRRAFVAVLAEPEPAQRLVRATALQSQALWTIFILVGVILAVSLTVAWVAGAILSEPLLRIRAEALRIAEGKLTRPAIIPAEGELWSVSASFTRLQTQLAGVLGRLTHAGQAIEQTTRRMVGTSARYQAGAASQASSLDQTSATTEELARSARQIAQSASEVTRIAQETLQAAQFGKQSAGEFSDSIGRMHQDHTAIAQSVRRLSHRIQQIGAIVQSISGVADRSELLALNAELEGTKAGDTGRNFSLVAGEMRRLAENVIESTQEIGSLIDEISGATQAAVIAAESGLGATEEGRGLSKVVAERLEEIVALAGKTSDSVRTISLATQQQKAGTDQLAEAMSEILRTTQTTLAATGDVTSANGNLTTLAAALQDVVKRFELSSRGEGS